MPGSPPDDSAADPPSPSSGAVAATLLSVLAVPVTLFHGFFALLLNDPPVCYWPLTDAAQAQCEQARAEGYSVVPSILLGGVALLPPLAVAAVWVWRRVVAVRWIALAVFAASFPLAHLVMSTVAGGGR